MSKPSHSPDAAAAAPAASLPGDTRVLLCTNYVDHILYFFIRELGTLVQLDLLCSQANEWTQRLEADGVPMTLLRPHGRFDARYRRAIESLYAQRRWDIAQCIHGNAELANLIQWSRGKVPIVGYRAYIGHLTWRESPAMYWSVRNPSVAGVVAVSSAVRDYLESFRFLRPRNVHVVNHGIDPDWIRRETEHPSGLRAEIGADEDTLVVAVMANLRPYKQFGIIVHAARALERHAVRFVHIGNDAGWAAMKDKPGNLHFLGHRARPWSLIADADLFASTAHNEAFGRSNLEAMACGKAMIGSNTGGLLDLIEHDVTGRLFESKNADDFTAQVLFYRNNPLALRTHASNTVDRVARLFSTQHMARAYATILAEVLERRRA